MPIKTENEITVRVLETLTEIIDALESAGFKKKTSFLLDDYYFVPSYLDINNLSTRNILNSAVLVRNISYPDKKVQVITYKKKEFGKDDTVVKQEAFNCYVEDYNDARELFNKIGYIEIMNIVENDLVYKKDNFELVIKCVKDKDILIEIETNIFYKSISGLIHLLDNLNLRIDKSNYFVKKAEEELNKVLGRYGENL